MGGGERKIHESLDSVDRMKTTNII